MSEYELIPIFVKKTFASHDHLQYEEYNTKVTYKILPNKVEELMLEKFVSYLGG